MTQATPHTGLKALTINHNQILICERQCRVPRGVFFNFPNGITARYGIFSACADYCNH